MLKPNQVRQHLKYMSGIGFAVEPLLDGTGIAASRLEDASYLVSSNACHKLVENMLLHSGEEQLGLKIGTATSINDLGIIGYAMASSSTLGQAIGLWLQYGNSPVGFPFTMAYLPELTGGQWGVSIASDGMSGSVYRFYVEQILGMGLSFGKLLTGESFSMASVDFSFPEPDSQIDYAKAFGCPVSFNAASTRAIVDAPLLSAAVSSNDSELRELCIRHCGQLLRHIERHGPVSTRLRDALTRMGKIPDLDEAAEALNMSPRSLRRRLKEEQTTFQAVLDEFRADLAKEYIQDGLVPVKEIAFLLGYAHVETFRQAFRRWVGCSVGDYQRR